ncbi:acetyl/propionyl/methylcrotonyl-CoA carboxylase subunit alpha [Patulibacter americanus]|uniref:acetyl/propionyl/methylcrotonyl-CoA carboxylase subunit alpha n=1 Tax=Patulibacter americanus TaxID=588672 RepID=UPI0003B3920A|nr:biotin carboxylase N-terminal domain-containing protein [Patulibacter americanus]
MPERVLIANRGEIAVRIARTLTRLGVASVAVHAPEDAGAPHVHACDVAVALAPPPGGGSPYLDVAQLARVATDQGCDAVHPGYGFLAERADAAQAFVDAGITWIGPPPAAIELLGDKIASKATAGEAGVPVVPGLRGTDVDADAVARFADEAGLPLLLKASAGGGGKGMRRVDDAAAIPAAVDAARREATAAFGRGELLVERLIAPARHVEVQVALDEHGGAWAIGERECSLQRRHQKLLEESPAACLSPGERRALHDAAVRLARAAGYRNLGTVEFLLDVSGGAASTEGDGRGGASDGAGDRPFFFLEMNARLQVEHPVTELVHGLDLVALQLRIADGEPLDDDPSAGPPEPVGHAIEARITAERVALAPPSGPVASTSPGGTAAAPSGAAGSAAHGPARAASPGTRSSARFLPAVGPVLAYAEPAGAGVRVDSGIAAGTAVTTAFDPMLLKVIAHGRDRAQALTRLDRALAGLVLLGVETNVGFLRRLLARPEVADDALTTTLVEELLADPDAAAALAAPPADARDAALRALVAARHAEVAAADPGPFGLADSWRSGVPGWTHLDLLDPDDAPVAVRARAVPGGVEVVVGDDGSGAPTVAAPDPRATVAHDGPWTWLHTGGDAWSWRDAPEATGGPSAAAGGLAAPLPGVVLAVRAAPGDRVVAGQSLVVLESMKMELDVAAPHDGVVGAIHVAVGEHVARGQTLAAVEEEGA